jgi:hypothetical protein
MALEMGTVGAAYVYALKVDGVVRYIGKGMDGRMSWHVAEARSINRRRDAGLPLKPKMKFHLPLAAAIRAGAKVTETKLAKGLTEAEAWRIEASKIAAIEARRPGQLWNFFGKPSRG